MFRKRVYAASTTPGNALPAEKPTVRSTWLKLIALPVSAADTSRTMNPGTAANTQPTPKPERTAHAKQIYKARSQASHPGSERSSAEPAGDIADGEPLPAPFTGRRLSTPGGRHCRTIGALPDHRVSGPLGERCRQVNMPDVA